MELHEKSRYYFNNITLLENTLLLYFCEAKPLKLINKKFSSLNYEKYNTHLQPHGLIETYNKDTKIIVKKEHYKNGRREGLFEKWYSDDKLSERSNWKDGQMDGLYEEWYSSGILRYRINYKKDGSYENWHSDGKLFERKNYINEKLDGMSER